MNIPCNMGRIALCFLLFFALITASYAQTSVPADTTTEKNKTKFFDKIGHWISAYALSDEDFMTGQRNAFKSDAFAEVYIDGVLDYDAWMFNLLNRVTQARIEIKQTPNLVFGVKFKPKDSNLNSYSVQLTLQGSSEVKVKLDDIIADVSKKYLTNKTYSEPSNAVTDIEAALGEAMNVLAGRLGKTLAQDPMVRLQGEIFWDGHTISLLESDGNSIELEAIDKNLKPLSSSEITWTNADPFQSKGVVDMSGVQSKDVTLSRNGGDKMTVTLKRGSGSLDLNEMLKALIIEALATKKKEAQDSIQKFKQDSIANTNDAARLIAQIESANFQLEDDGSTLTPMFPSPLVYEEPKEFTKESKDNRVLSFLALKKRKKIRSDIRRKVNVVALADLIVDHPDQVKLLLDELLKNSGRLVAQLMMGKDAEGQKAAARNIVIEFLNKDLERIAGGYYTDAQSQYPVLTVTPVAPTTPTFSADKYVYINPYANFAGKDSLVTALEKYLPTLDTALYVFINYSQDNSRAGYLARGKSGRPKGLPAGARYKVYTLVNMPGSFIEDAYGVNIVSDKTNFGEIILDDFEFLNAPSTFKIAQLGSTTQVKELAPEVVKLLLRADNLLKEEILAQRLIRYGRVGTASLVFITGLLYSPDLGDGKTYNLNREFNQSLNDWSGTLGISDIETHLFDCSINNVEYQKLLIYDYLEIYKDYALFEVTKGRSESTQGTSMGLEEIELIPSALLKHSVIVKAQQAGDLIGGYGNKMVIKRNFSDKIAAGSNVYTAYKEFINRQLDKVAIKNNSLTGVQAVDALRKLMCKVQSAVRYAQRQGLATEVNYYQQRSVGDDLFFDPEWLGEQIIDLNDESDLEYYESLLQQGKELTEVEWNHYLHLLCAVRKDCRDAVNYEEHHIIPQELKDHPLVQAALTCSSKFRFNNDDNLISLEKYLKNTGKGRHGNHPYYNDWVLILLNQLLTDYRSKYGNGPIDPCTARKILLDLIKDILKPAIQEKSNEKINELGRRKLGI